MLDDALQPEAPAPPPGAALLSYIEDMLLELAHMASAGGEQALAASLAIAAIQCGARLKAIPCSGVLTAAAPSSL